jgi:hypothetical protein
VVGGKAVAGDLRGVEEAVGEILLEGEPEVGRLNIYASGNGAEEAIGVGWVRKIGDGAVALASEEKAAAFVKRSASDQIPSGDGPEAGGVRKQGVGLGGDWDLGGVRGGAGVRGEHTNGVER